MAQKVLSPEEIEQRRKAADLPYRAVCKEAGVAPTTWRRMMAGDNSPTWSTLEKLSDAVDRMSSTARAAE